MTEKVIISEQGAGFLRQGQNWMYCNNLINDISAYPDGSIAAIYTEAGEYLGTGFLSTKSHIVVRILTRKENSEINEDFFRDRIAFAWNYRKTAEPDNLTNCRVIFGEADGLPGLTVDRYNDVLVTQITCSGMEVRKDSLYAILMETIEGIHAIYERNDVQSRKKEGLSLYKGFYENKEHETNLQIQENGLKLNVDIENGQKTGYFLDQKNNRLLIRQLAKGKRVLDCFTHTGGFALNAAIGGAKAVTAVDISASALAEAEKNAQMNGLRISFVQADVFAYLDELPEGAFDLIILDPPAFTKDRRTVMKAYNGYKRINEQAMKKLGYGGYLATCSCSRYMENELFEKMLREAASEAGVTLRQISVSQQAPDHPILWTMAETAYLKFYLFQIVQY